MSALLSPWQRQAPTGFVFARRYSSGDGGRARWHLALPFFFFRFTLAVICACYQQRTAATEGVRDGNSPTFGTCVRVTPLPSGSPRWLGRTDKYGHEFSMPDWYLALVCLGVFSGNKRDEAASLDIPCSPIAHVSSLQGACGRLCFLRCLSSWLRGNLARVDRALPAVQLLLARR